MQAILSDTYEISPLLTDFYQFSMAYSYFKAGIHEKQSTFEMFFRKCPFNGEYAVFAGLGRVLDFILSYHFTLEDIKYLRSVMPYAEEEFFTYLCTLNYRMLEIIAPREGTLVFANEPIIIVRGPLIFCQLLETTLLVLVNYATLVATNASRFRVALCPSLVHPRKISNFRHALIKRPMENIVTSLLTTTRLSEFGLRRAQGINGGLAASEYAIIGGFNDSSNVLASHNIGTPPSGTVAHAFILSFTTNIASFIASMKKRQAAGERVSLLEGKNEVLGEGIEDFIHRCFEWKGRFFMHSATDESEIGPLKIVNPSPTSQSSAVTISPSADVGAQLSADLLDDEESEQGSGTCREPLFPVFNEYRSNESELAAFIVYAYTQPKRFLGLLDTYNTLKSGLPNFLIVAAALIEKGVQPLGIRLDSGDLTFLSKEVRKAFSHVNCVITRHLTSVSGEKPGVSLMRSKIVASNDLSEEVVHALIKEGCQIDVFGVGTNLVTCKGQPSLGGVYKIVDIDGAARVKMSEEANKSTIPCFKDVYRLYTSEGVPFVDLMVLPSETIRVGEVVMCVHHHDDMKRFLMKPSCVEKLHEVCLSYGAIKYPHRTEDSAERGAAGGPRIHLTHPSCTDIQAFVMRQLIAMRSDHLRFINPTPYKISLSEQLSGFCKRVILETRNATLIE